LVSSEGHRLFQVNNEVLLPAPAGDVFRLMLEQVPKILHGSGLVGVKELSWMPARILGTTRRCAE
jgi:hypothetical protein